MSTIQSQTSNLKVMALVEMFYGQVLSCLLDHIYKYNKYRYQGMSQEDIQSFQQAVKALLRDPQRLFQKAKKYREGSQQSTEIFALVGKKDLQDIKTEMKMQEPELAEKQQSNEGLLPYDSTNEQLNQHAFRMHENFQQACFKRQQGKYQFRFGTKYKRQQEISVNADQKNSQEKLEQTQVDYMRFLSYRLMGQYQGSEFKYIRKQDKYQLLFRDVFLKSEDGEQYFPEVFLEMFALDKSLIKQYAS